jgi:hypothetical protein
LINGKMTIEPGASGGTMVLCTVPGGETSRDDQKENG